MRKKLPVGIESFEEFFTEDYYYVDKTMLIEELLQNGSKVNLFTRPRRFGKTLTMKMLQAFFEIGCNKALFDGLQISSKRELCEEYMGQFPVIFVTLKSLDGLHFQSAKEALRFVIGTEASRFRFLEESNQLTEDDKNRYRALVTVCEKGVFTAREDALLASLQTLSQLLEKHYGKKVILLIDEYDVPLDRAFQAGYYDEMVALIRSLLGNVLKTNDSLQFAVLTGCLRISKESIFTGLNNLQTHTITDYQYDEYFGFTDEEVARLLAYYGLSDYAATMKEWYDGYRFGGTAVYCPWDVVNYCAALLANRKSFPKNYWANTSGNAMVRRFIDKSDRQTKSEMERLIAGESITKRINLELTYNELDRTIDNLWSVLFTTGYLTQCNMLEEDRYELVIPNRQIRSLFITQIQAWFQDTTRKDTSRLEELCKAVIEGRPKQLEKLLGGYLWNSISIRDYAGRREYRGDFYHGLLLGLLQYASDWVILSNGEAGLGYSDILIETQEGVGIVMELKYAEDGDLQKGCEEALGQIAQKEYTARLEKDGMEVMLQYGIAFYKKRCKVMKKE